MNRSFLPFCMLMLGCHVGQIVAVEARLPYRCQVYGCGPPYEQHPDVCNLETGLCEYCHYGDNYNCLYFSDHCASDIACDASHVYGYDEYTQCSLERPDVCLCQAGFIGDDCSQNRLAINCDEVGNERIKVTITPYDYSDGRTFAGTMVVNWIDHFNHEHTDPSCILEQGVETTIGIHLDEDGVCGHLAYDGVEYYTYIYIQHNPMVSSVADHIIRASCSTQQSGLVDNFVIVDSPNFETLPPIESTIRNSADGFTVQLKMQTAPTVWVPLTDDIFPVEFGADLSIFITHDNTEFMVMEIVAQNMPFDTPEQTEGLQSILIMEHWCVTPDGLPLVRFADGEQTGVVHEDGDGNNGGVVSQKMFRFDFNAFRFTGPYFYFDVYFRVFVCSSGCYYDSPTECMNQVTNYFSQAEVAPGATTRRRRDVVDRENSTENIAVSFQVISPEISSKRKAVSDGKAELSSCFKSMSVLLPMILLATLLVLAMIMSFFFCQKIYSVDSAKMKQSSANHKA